MNEVQIANKFKPLFRLLDSNWHPEIDTVIMTGGRYSLKSYTVSIFALIAMVDYKWNTLYTRYTNMSIEDSVKPEVTDKIDLLGYSGKVNDTKTQIECRGNRISFKGIKTGSGQQTANLKSLSGFNCFVNDEAEELPDYKTFKKIFYSIRDTDKRNLTILILNPTGKDHWIFKEFFEKKGLDGGDNCIKDNVLYIHTSYLDADFSKMPPNILAEYERLKVDDPREYENIVLGGWLQEREGTLYPAKRLNHYTELTNEPDAKVTVTDIADMGTDYLASITAYIYGKKVYIEDVVFTQKPSEITKPLVIGMIEKHQPSFCFFESNNGGRIYASDIQQKLNELGFRGKVAWKATTQNKETRILMHAGAIMDNFYFKKMPSGTMYSDFMRELSSYVVGAKNPHDDAPDVLTLLNELLMQNKSGGYK